MCRNKGHSGPGIRVISVSQPHLTAWPLHHCPVSGGLGEKENSTQHKALCNWCKGSHKRSSSDTNNSLKIITLKANYSHKTRKLSAEAQALLTKSLGLDSP